MIYGFSFFKDRLSTIGKIELDVLTKEEISLPGEVTRYPVEDGVEISDHIILKADELRIEGLVSHASGRLLDISGLFEKQTKLLDTVDAIAELRELRDLVQITTGLTTYYDMALVNAKITRESGGRGGNWIHVDFEFRQVITVELRTTLVPAAPETANRTGASRTPAGRATPTSSNNVATVNRPQSAAAAAADAASRSGSNTLSRVGDFFGGR